jgi:peptidoglycan/xylan/chitin deacetylase (PgdA/CDA1 family)
MLLPIFQRPVYKPVLITGALLTAVLLVLANITLISYGYFILAGLALSGVLFWGAFKISSGFYMTPICKTNTLAPEIALTFDDGPHENTAAILSLLKKYGAKATFFVTGKNIMERPELLIQMKQDGHQVGNHSFSHHKMFSLFSVNEMVEELAKTSILIKKYAGGQPMYFRPPFGVTNPRIAIATKKTGMEVIGWSVRSLDTVTKNADAITKRIKNKTRFGDIILLHDYTPHVLVVLEQLLKHYSSLNYKFVTVQDLIEEK